MSDTDAKTAPDRAALIEAALPELCTVRCDSHRHAIGRALDRVLPLIADAVAAMTTEGLPAWMEDNAAANAYGDAADLIRSYLEETR